MTALPNAMATRNWFLTTAKALERALRQAEFDRPATDSAPFFFYGTPRVIDHDPPTPVLLPPDHIVHLTSVGNR